MDHWDFDYLQSQLCTAALDIIRYPDILEDEAYRAMLAEHGFSRRWWDGAFIQNEEDEAKILEASRAFAQGKPLPELSLGQRGRFGLRLRLASRILRAYSRRNFDQPAKGWFPEKLYKMKEPQLIEWLLVEASGFCMEIFDETLTWDDNIGSLDTAEKLLQFPPGS